MSRGTAPGTAGAFCFLGVSRIGCACRHALRSRPGDGIVPPFVDRRCGPANRRARSASDWRFRLRDAFSTSGMARRMADAVLQTASTRVTAAMARSSAERAGKHRSAARDDVNAHGTHTTLVATVGLLAGCGRRSVTGRHVVWPVEIRFHGRDVLRNAWCRLHPRRRPRASTLS